MQATEKIWMNGELIDWDDAKIHVGAHGLHYGTGVFEGIRCYDTPQGPAVFRLRDHLERLHNSAKLLYMELPYSVDELRDACMDVICANGLPSCYLRPIAFYGYGELGVQARGNPVDVVIMSWPWGTYLGEDGLKNGIRAKVSSWQRIGPNVIPHVAKATGIYLNSMLAVTEAINAGYDEAIMLTARRVRRGRLRREHLRRQGRRLYTPDLSAGILSGSRATRSSRSRRIGLHRRREEPDPLRPLIADEVFMCGTAAEVTPVREVDDVVIGVGEITKAIQKAYLETVNGNGETDRWAHWRDPVENFARAQA